MRTIYYKVKPEYDNYRLRTKQHGYCDILIGNELFTERELTAHKSMYVNFPADCVEKIKISKNMTYNFFGARFADWS